MMIVPIQALPSQSALITLGGQNCNVTVYQKSTGMFLDLAVSGRPIISGAICRDRVLLVRQAYLGFTGDLSFMDTQGTEDPRFTGLGARWVLMYLTPDDLA
jgi:hypothetical protein